MATTSASAAVNSPVQSLPTSSGESRLQEKKRQTQACDGCRSKKRRCDGIRPICTQCRKSRVREGETIKCTYLATTKKRGPRRGYRNELMDRLTTLENMLLPGSENSTSTVAPADIHSAHDELRRLKEMMAGRRKDSRDTESTVEDQQTHSPLSDNDVLRTDSVFSTSSSESPELLNNTYSGFPFGSLQEVTVYNGNGSLDMLTDDALAVSTTISAQQLATTQQTDTVEGSESMFEELDSFLSMSPTSDILDPHSTRIWELNGILDPNADLSTFTFDAATYEAFNLSIPPYLHSPVVPAYNPQPDLHTHLRQLGLALIQMEFPSQDSLSATDAIHSAVVNVLYANGAKFSSHPDLERQYGSRLNAVKSFLSKAEEALVARTGDTIATIQSMLLLGGLYYEMDEGWKACKWILEASNICIMKNFDRSTHHVPIYTVFHGHDDTTITSIPLSQREARWNTWATAVLYDAYASLASGFPALIEESDYTELLFDRRPWEDAGAYGSRKMREGMQCIGPGPSDIGLGPHTIFHSAGLSDRFESALQSRGRNSDEVTLMLQISFLVRRVLRHISQCKPREGADQGSLGRSAAAVLSSLPGENDTRTLHEAIVTWFSTVPDECRGFSSLSEFRDIRRRIQTQWKPSCQSLQTVSLFLVCLSLLHYHSRDKTSKTHRIDDRASAPIRISSIAMLTITRRALAWLLRQAYIPAPPASPLRTTPGHAQTLKTTPFTAQSPPPPPPLSISPMLALCVLLIASAELSCQSPTIPMQELLTDIQTIFLPFMDNLGRIFPMSVRYAARMRAIVGGVIGYTGEVRIWKGGWEGGTGVCGGGWGIL